MTRWWRRQPRSGPPGPLRDLAAEPPAGDPTPFSEVDFLALDLETTGLDPRRDHVLEVGWVPLCAGQVVLGEAHGTLLRPAEGAEVGESAVVHGLTDDLVAAAPTLSDVLPELLGALRGRVLLAHHAPIELGFLDRALREAFGARLPATVVDTLTLQRRLLVRGGGEPPPGTLRLDVARRHFGLPQYAAHRAVTDAIATAELLLAQAAELGNRLGREPELGDLSPVRRG